jgi:hypothetical protein
LLVGLDSGADHPFGALLGVVTEFGIVIVGEYLERMRALSQHKEAICTAFRLAPGMQEIRWSANKNEANLRLEWGLKGIGIIQAEAKHEVGIQRVASWLHTGQLFFAYTVPRCIAQMKAYRYAPNTTTDGQKKKEAVFKLKDELPDALRYMLMGWPSLPSPTVMVASDRMAKMDPQTRYEIERMRKHRAPKEDLEPAEQGYPVGDFFGNDGEGETYVGQ